MDTNAAAEEGLRRQLPYLAKKNLLPWYGQLMNGQNIIEPDVESLRKSNPLIYEILKQQQIRTVVLSPLLEARCTAQSSKIVQTPCNAGKTVLLVDDSPELLKCNTRILRPQGYEILTAATLGEATASIFAGSCVAEFRWCF